MEHHLILRVVTKIVIPFILLFALYVQFHGDFGPGGGFQAGVIFGSAMILYALVFGLERAERVIPPQALRVLMAAGVLIFAGTGVAAMLLGGNFLDYGYLAHDPRHVLRHPAGGIRRRRHGHRDHDHAVFRLHGPQPTRQRVRLKRTMDILGHYNYWIVIFLMMAGFYTVISRGHLVKKIVGLNIFQTSVFIMFISMGYVEGGRAPILEAGEDLYSNPLPHVLILTAIVVGVATTALALALVLRIREAYGTVEEDEIHAQDESF